MDYYFNGSRVVYSGGLLCVLFIDYLVRYMAEWEWGSNSSWGSDYISVSLNPHETS